MNHLLQAALNRRQFLAGLAATLVAPALHAAPASSTAGKALADLGDRYFDAMMDANPTWASYLGIATPDQAASLVISIGPAERRAVQAIRQATYRALQTIDTRDLTDAEQISHAQLRFTLEQELADSRFPDHLLPLAHMGDEPIFTLALATDNGLSPFATAEDYTRHLTRLKRLPAWCRQAIVNMREGVKRGIVQPAIIMERLQPMLAQLTTADLDHNPYYKPILRLPAGWPADQKAALTTQYRAVIEQELRPALLALSDYVTRHYLPRCRKSTGYGALPGGQAWYASKVALQTTTRLKPADIHAVGLREVARLRGEIARLQQQEGHTGSLQAYVVAHKQKAAIKPFKTEQDVLAAFADLNRKIAPQLPALFKHLPKAPLEIRPEPELTRATASDHYQSPKGAGTPGVFFAVIQSAKDYPTTEMTSLFLHEGQPGHHFQIALTMEAPLSRLQRYYLGYNAYVEGWALYAETLGYQMGLYEDLDAHLGHLLAAMWRAVRLVVDTGMHAKGWTREQAIEYWMAQTGDTEDDTRAQIERYMVWPGQALGYAVGRMKIESLRDEARNKLGERFSLADFHDQVLNSGALPLDLLDGKIKRWITNTTPA
ncbi:DUF885 domain-containing protein [Chitinimonas naiadis]